MDDNFWVALTLVVLFSAVALREFYRTRKMAQDPVPGTGAREKPSASSGDFKRFGINLAIIAAAFFTIVPGMQAWSRWIRPRHKVYRDSLLKVAVPALHCPAEQLTFEQVDSAGVRVSGCGRTARFMLSAEPGKRPARPMWFPDTGCRETYFLVITAPC